MKKLVACLLVFVALCFAGCTAAPAEDNLISKVNGANSKKTNSINSQSASFQIINNGRMNCAGDNGYYYLTNDVIRLKDGTYAHHMMFIDYGLKKEIYLCNRPGCGHDTIECPAVFGEKEIDMGGSLFIHQDFLYLFSHEQDRDGVSYNQSNSGSPLQEGEAGFSGGTASLYRMKLDGTQRKMVYTFDGALALENMVMGGEQTLYFITKKLVNGQADSQMGFITSTERTLVKLNTKNWKLDIVGLMEPDTKIIGTFGDNLITSQIMFDHALTEAERFDDKAYLEAYKRSETHLAVFNPVNGETEVILKLPNHKLNSFAVQNDVLYVSTEGEGKIWQIDLNTNEKNIFVETSYCQIDCAYQDVLLCYGWERNSAEAGIATFIQFGSGKIGQSNLVTASMKSPIEIRAEAQDHFLVIYDIDAEIDTAYDNGQYSIKGYRYALLAKEDLYQGQGNYQPIEMIGFGE